MNFLALLVGIVLGAQIMWYVTDKRIRNLLKEATTTFTDIDRLEKQHGEKYASMLQYSRGRYNGLLDAVYTLNGSKAKIEEYK